MMAPLADKQMVRFAYSFLASFGFGYASYLSFYFLSYQMQVSCQLSDLSMP